MVMITYNYEETTLFCSKCQLTSYYYFKKYSKVKKNELYNSATETNHINLYL